MDPKDPKWDLAATSTQAKVQALSQDLAQSTSASAVSSSVGQQQQHATTSSSSSSTSVSGNPAVKSVPAATPKLPALKFPVRIGITWKKGERLEALDFSNTWYPSKIVEICEEDQAVLIHFEGWNQRYDEWVEMASHRLRPTTRHSERKDNALNKKRKIYPHPIYRPGDEVLAKWKDCKKYPAKISRLIEHTTYEVVFYDGVTHLIQAINIQPMPESMKATNVTKAPPQPKNFSFKQVQLNLPSSVRKKQEQLKAKKDKSYASKLKKKLSPLQGYPRSGFLPKVKLRRDRELDVYSVVGHKQHLDQPRNTSKDNPVTITCEATLSTLSEAEYLQLFGPGAAGKVCASPEKRPADVRPGPSMAEEKSLPVVTSPGSGTTTPSSWIASASRVRKRAHTDTSVSASKKVAPAPKAKKQRLSSTDSRATLGGRSPLKKAATPLLGSAERSKSLDLPLTGNPVPQGPLAPFPPQFFIPSKAFIVEEDHNPFKCPFEGCPKDFRKENLLRYHIKYYHSDVESAGAPVSSPSASTATTQQSSAIQQTSSLSSTATIVSTGLKPVNTPSAQPSPRPTSVAAVATPGCAETSAKMDLELASTASGSLPASSVGSMTSPAVVHPVSTPLQPEPPVTTGSAPAVPLVSRRKRRKTDSICSTDSEMSISSKGKSSKRQRNDSEISVTSESPHTAGQELLTDSSRLLQDLASVESQTEKGEGGEEDLAWPDTEEADEEEMASDMVNCVCGYRHTVGLMIQCEVCLCWQHFKCTDVKKAGKPPANYVCAICQKPPGLRDSCKFLQDLGWERRGELPTYPFKHLADSSRTSHLTTLACECNDLMATLHGVKRALHSTRRQIKISKEEEEPEFQLWQTDWDNWIKPEEDVTLTSASFDVEPSTPATSASATDAIKEELQDTTEQTSAAPDSVTTASLSGLSLSSPKPAQQPIDFFSVSSTPPKKSSTCEREGVPKEPHVVSSPGKGSGLEIGESSEAAKSEMSSGVTSGHTAQAAASEYSQLTINTGESSGKSPPVPTPLSASSSLSSPSCPANASTTPPASVSPTPYPPPPSPWSQRRACMTSALRTSLDADETNKLVKDLFPGPAGDASSSLVVPTDIADDTNIAQGHLENSLSNQTSVSDNSTSVTAEDNSVLAKEYGNSRANTVSETLSATSQSVQKPAISTLASTVSASTAEEKDNAVSGSSKGQPHPTSPSQNTIETSHCQSQPAFAEKMDEEADEIQGKEPVDPQKEEMREDGVSTDTTAAQVHTSQDIVANHVSGETEEAGQPNGDLSPGYGPPLKGLDDLHRASLFTEDDEDTQDNDTDTAEESVDPYRHCERNLLLHIQHVQSGVEAQLLALEERIMELESSEQNNPTIQLSADNILNDVPALKKSLGKLSRYLTKVQYFSS